MTLAPLASAPALVFGGSRGMGAAIVRRLAAEGRPVTFTYAASEEAAFAIARDIEAAGGRALPIRADSADADAVAAAVDAALDGFGSLGVLVVNAGVLIPGAIEEYSITDFDRMLAVNVRGVFAAIRHAAPHLMDGGRIVTIGSNTADRIGSPGSSVYAMTKAAVAQLVRGAALDFAARGITVNNVQPGPIETDMTAGLMEYIRPRLPLGRIGQPEEVAGLVAWLTGPDAGYMTGASLTMDGGWTA